MLAGSLLVANTAIAANWVKIDDSDDAVIYADRGSIKVNGDVISYWEKWEYKKGQTIAGKRFKSIVMYTHIDCNQKDFADTTKIFYDKDGNVVISGDFPLDMKIIPPGTIEESISTIMCRILNSPSPQ